MIAVHPLDVYVADMDGDDLDLLRSLLDQWNRKLRRNLLRTAYYDGKNRLRDLGISIPPQLKSVETVVGWPAKAVDAVAHRVRFDGFVAPGVDEDPFGLAEVFSLNRMQVELPQAVTSALQHSVVFVTATHGDVTVGEPDVMVQVRSALHATGLWDTRRRALKAGLSIVDVDDDGRPVELVLYLTDRVGVIWRAGGRWRAVWRRNPIGRVMMEPLMVRPDLLRPFGRSRITRAVMSITDEAVRTVLRTEVSAEFFTAPQRWALGVTQDDFQDASGNPVPQWESIIGRVWAIGKDDDGDLPNVGQFPQMSMQPHTEHLRAIASRFAGETSLPVSSLGIVQDNPASAEAIHAAREDLVIEASSAGRSLGAGLLRVAENVVMLRDGLTEPPAEMVRLEAQWANPATPSVVSASDAIHKQTLAFPWMAESTVALEQLGYSRAQITRLLADKRRFEGSALFRSLLDTADVTVDAVES